jgi:hypothetical protein
MCILSSSPPLGCRRWRGAGGKVLRIPAGIAMQRAIVVHSHTPIARRRPKPDDRGPATRHRTPAMAGQCVTGIVKVIGFCIGPAKDAFAKGIQPQMLERRAEIRSEVWVLRPARQPVAHPGREGRGVRQTEGPQCGLGAIAGWAAHASKCGADLLVSERHRRNGLCFVRQNQPRNQPTFSAYY